MEGKGGKVAAGSGGCVLFEGSASQAGSLPFWLLVRKAIVIFSSDFLPLGAEGHHTDPSLQ